MMSRADHLSRRSRIIGLAFARTMNSVVTKFWWSIFSKIWKLLRRPETGRPERTAERFRERTLRPAFLRPGRSAKGARKWRKLASLRQCGHLFATLISRAQELLRSLHEPPHPLSFRGWGRLTAGGFGEWWLVWGDCPKTRMSLH